MKILGVSAFYHDSAAALVVDGKIVAAAQEERFSRIKHDHNFPLAAIKYCLSVQSINISDLDAVVFYDKPFLKMERLLETYYAFAPRGLRSFLQAIPVLIREKLFLKQHIKKILKKMDPLFDSRKTPLLFSEHHLSHAASAFYPSPFEEATILTIDGVGEWATAGVFRADQEGIKIIKELRYPHSVGLFYSSFTYFLGFKVNSGEYKLMGLAPYGKKDSRSYKTYKELIWKNIVQLKDDGSIWLNSKYFKYSTGLKMIDEKKWTNLFQSEKRKPDQKITQEHCNLALAVQEITNEIVLEMAKAAIKCTGYKNLCLAGGVALNCVSNANLLESGIFTGIYIQPAAGDSGGALGAALAISYNYFKQQRTVIDTDPMHGALLGPEYSRSDILHLLLKSTMEYEQLDNSDVLVAKVAQLIDEGKIIGWFQGRMEFGPRALGSRSILADARSTNIQDYINQHIKFRESFRPFGASVLSDDAKEIFSVNVHSPYMLYVFPVKDHFLIKNQKNKPAAKCGPVSLFDSITHIDNSSRIQIVDQTTNPLFFALLREIKKRTGYGIVLNTSFNSKDEPMVCTPEDAIKCFQKTKLDYLVLDCFILRKPKDHHT